MKLLLLLATVGAQISVTPCGGTMTLLSAAVSPINPVAQKPFALHIDYRNPATVTGGTCETSIVYNFIPIQPMIEPLCANIPCPLVPGTYSNDTVSTWPSGLSGTITTTLKWFDPNHILLLCFKIGGKVSYVQKHTRNRINVTNATNATNAIALVQKSLFRRKL